MSETPPPASNTPAGPGGRIGPLPVLGCVALLLILVIVFFTAVGGSFQSLAILGGLVVVAGVGVVLFLVRKNRGR